MNNDHPPAPNPETGCLANFTKQTNIKVLHIKRTQLQYNLNLIDVLQTSSSTDLAHTVLTKYSQKCHADKTIQHIRAE